MRRRVAGVAAVALVAGLPAAAVAHSQRRPAAQRPSCAWSTAGFDVGHTLTVPLGCTGIRPANAPTLAPSWFVRTHDSVSASPVVDHGSLYVGAWDGMFYAVDVATGKVRWTYQIHTHAQNAFGRIVSTATVLRQRDPSARGGWRRVVIFGGGSAVWALDARTGKRLAVLNLDPRTMAARKAPGASDQTVEVESSPVVGAVKVGGHRQRRIYVGMDVHNDPHVGRTGIVAMRLTAHRGNWKLAPVWKFDPETSRVYPGRRGLTVGSGKGMGCGGVWSSPALDLAHNRVDFGTASCSYPEIQRKKHENWSEAMWSINAATGQLVWRFRPDKTSADAHRDEDFGAMANLFTTPSGREVFGEGRKDGCYYARSAATGRGLWRNCTATSGYLQSDFAVGGYLGTPAIQSDTNGHGVRVVGATAVPIPHSVKEATNATVAVRGINASTGATDWTYRLAGPSYGSTTVAGGVALVSDTFGSSFVTLNASTGLPLGTLPLYGPPSSAPAVVGNSVYVTTGTRETDLEYKAVGLGLEKLLAGPTGASPLSPLSGIYRFSLPQ